MSRPSAESLISKAVRTPPALPTKARAELAKLLEHNAQVGRAQRVPAEDAMQLLADGYNLRMGRNKFDRVIKQVFGRTWGAQ